MRVSVDDGRAAAKGGAETIFPPGTGSGVVHHADLHASDVNDPTLRQNFSQLQVVHVSHHTLHPSEPGQLLEHAHGDEVAGMQDEIRLVEQLEAGARKSSGPARQMRVRDDRDESQRYFLLLRLAFCTTAPARNGRLTKTLVRFVFISAWNSTAST